MKIEHHFDAMQYGLEGALGDYERGRAPDLFHARTEPEQASRAPKHPAETKPVHQELPLDAELTETGLELLTPEHLAAGPEGFLVAMATDPEFAEGVYETMESLVEIADTAALKAIRQLLTSGE